MARIQPWKATFKEVRYRCRRPVAQDQWPRSKPALVVQREGPTPTLEKGPTEPQLVPRGERLKAELKVARKRRRGLELELERERVKFALPIHNEAAL